MYSSNILIYGVSFLDKACIKIEDEESPWRLCTISQVEQVKTLISVMPIFGCTIVFNTILAQLQTFSVQQGSAMDTRLTKSFHIPPASLQSIPYMMLLFVVPLYDKFLVPLARKLTGHESGISPLHRIGLGLFVATFSMISAAVMEKKRRDAAVNSSDILSIFWITPQFLIFGLSEMLTAVGLIELFYKQSMKGMQAFLTAITYLSSVLVSVVNKLPNSRAFRFLAVIFLLGVQCEARLINRIEAVGVEAAVVHGATPPSLWHHYDGRSGSSPPAAPSTYSRFLDDKREDPQNFTPPAPIAQTPMHQ